MKTDRIKKAEEIAYNKHDNPHDPQRYGHQPYSKHLDDVKQNALKYIYHVPDDDKEDVIISCLFHDTIEDTDLSAHDLSELMGKKVANLVLRVSNELGWDRKERNFKTYPKIWMNDLAIFIKLCDRIANTKNSKDTEHRMYRVYRAEYPIFRYALKVRGLYSDMWKELDELNEFKEDSFLCECKNSTDYEI